jgi:hypothetical protein
MKPSQAKNLYEILDVEKNASPAEIDNAFRKLAFVWHPDKHPHDLEDADAEFKILMNAYCILSDPTRKRDYDRYHFNQTIYPNYGKYRDERLTIYRARQRAAINRKMQKNDKSCQRYKALSRCSFYAMIVSAGWFVGMLIYQNQNIANDRALGPYLLLLPLIVFNGALISYVISQKEIIETRKQNRSLAIKLYAHVDEQ